MADSFRHTGCDSGPLMQPVPFQDTQTHRRNDLLRHFNSRKKQMLEV